MCTDVLMNWYDDIMNCYQGDCVTHRCLPVVMLDVLTKITMYENYHLKSVYQ